MGASSEGLPVSFSSFAITIASTAMVHLGETADPATGKKEVNLPLARHAIDALGMLEAKTQGNLDPEEAKLIESLLDETRTRFVQLSQAR